MGPFHTPQRMDAMRKLLLIGLVAALAGCEEMPFHDDDRGDDLSQTPHAHWEGNGQHAESPGQAD